MAPPRKKKREEQASKAKDSAVKKEVLPLLSRNALEGICCHLPMDDRWKLVKTNPTLQQASLHAGHARFEKVRLSWTSSCYFTWTNETWVGKKKIQCPDISHSRVKGMLKKASTEELIIVLTDDTRIPELASLISNMRLEETIMLHIYDSEEGMFLSVELLRLLLDGPGGKTPALPFHIDIYHPSMKSRNAPATRENLCRLADRVPFRIREDSVPIEETSPAGESTNKPRRDGEEGQLESCIDDATFIHLSKRGCSVSLNSPHLLTSQGLLDAFAAIAEEYQRTFIQRRIITTIFAIPESTRAELAAMDLPQALNVHGEVDRTPSPGLEIDWFPHDHSFGLALSIFKCRRDGNILRLQISC